MNQIFEYLIRPYQDLDILEVILEIVAVILGLTSVWFAKNFMGKRQARTHGQKAIQQMDQS